MYLGTQPYGLEGYLEHHGGMDGNLYRTETFGQPSTLRTGDVLANGLEIVREPYEAGNGGVALDLANGTSRRVAARLPLLLENGTNGKLPSALVVGDILETGDVVLAPSRSLTTDDVRYERHASEIEITINGGFDGAAITVPEDIVIALHSESYPPQPDGPFSTFITNGVLRMGARARKNLPNYGRLDGVPEPERVKGVFEQIDTLRSEAQAERAVYHAKLSSLQEACVGLRGVELVITGQLHGRKNTRVYDGDPRSLVKNMHIEVTSAQVNSYESQGAHVLQQLPFIEFQGRTILDGEHVSAWLGMGKLGVTAEIVESSATDESSPN